MTESSPRHDKADNPGMDRKELESAQKVIAGLLLARKNCSLYPEGHTISTASIEQFHTLLGKHVHSYGDLKIEVEKDRLASKGQVVHRDILEEGALPFILFRDGIRWIEFQEGIDLQETAEFLELVNKFSILSAEPEGDIVTELWEKRFVHIRYEATDTFSTADEDADMVTSPPQKRIGSTENLRETALAGQEPLPEPLIDPASLVLTPEDRMNLQEMLRMDEDGDPTAYLDALFDSLLQYREHENFEIILRVLEEEFTGSIARGDLAATSMILQRLQYVLDAGKAQTPGIDAFIEDFFISVSGANSLAPLAEVWPGIGPDQLKRAQEVFRLLHPEALPTLCGLLPLNQSTQKRQVLTGAITALASRDLTPLESVLKTKDEKLLERLVPVLAGLEGDLPQKYLLKLVRHPSPPVRQEAIKQAIRKGASLREVFPLIDDKDESVRRLILKQLSQERNPAAEKLLLEYLERRTFSTEESGHLIACFTALGQCGSAKALPFLRKTLLHRAWMPSFWRNAHRRGAAMALKGLGLKESQEILNKASRSLFPSVRGFAREAMNARA
ncbi:MAG TPA: HEAT repeat domain-containing protein [Deltaproteobacteria bacterium]|nr:HEAT repeat domain-containing protein [Deltaproteobacteria bacterium]